MSDRSNLRLLVLGALLFSLIVTLLGRLFVLQVLSADTYAKIGSRLSVREVITPAPRGLILDQAGRPLVGNRTSLVVSLDRATLDKQADHGKAVLTRLAGPLGTTYQALADRATLCGTDGAVRGVCWNGSPFQPIPVAKDVSTDLALSIMERRADYPGVVAQLESVRDYPKPDDVNAAHLLGYLGAVSQSELDAQQRELDEGTITQAQATLTGTDLVGRAGLEAQYDQQLRGQAGVKELSVDIAGNVLGTDSETDPTPGDYLVTNIDARLQSVVEKQLHAAILRARATPTSSGGHYKADSGAAVVLDVTNGRVLAMASYPTYDPDVWVGGIRHKEYKALTSKKANTPLLSRAVQGAFAPASTFKIATTAAALTDGYSGNSTYPCPSTYKIGDRSFRNYESHSYGDITLKRAIEVSCDTVYYRIAHQMWVAAGGLNAKPNAPDPIATMARAFGLGSRTGIDLPSETAGQVGGRAFKQAYWKQMGTAICQRAKTGYPEVARTDPKRAALLKAYAQDNCALKGAYQAGDAVNLAIGQGDTVASPLQMAAAYAALANGGVLYRPQVAKAIMTPDGKAVKVFKKVRAGKLPVSQQAQDYLRNAFRSTTVSGTGAGPFIGFPLGKIGGVATKTGTGEVDGKQSTSWFASYAPADSPKYAVVMMVSQGGTGSGTSGPSVRKIYEAIFGVKGSSVDPSRSVLVGGAPQTKLPTVNADGTPQYPGSDQQSGKQKAASGQQGDASGRKAPAAAAQDDAAAPSGAAAGLALAVPVLTGLRRRVRRRRTAHVTRGRGGGP